MVPEISERPMSVRVWLWGSPSCTWQQIVIDSEDIYLQAKFSILEVFEGKSFSYEWLYTFFPLFFIYFNVW